VSSKSNKSLPDVDPGLSGGRNARQSGPHDLDRHRAGGGGLGPTRVRGTDRTRVEPVPAPRNAYKSGSARSAEVKAARPPHPRPTPEIRCRNGSEQMPANPRPARMTRLTSPAREVTPAHTIARIAPTATTDPRTCGGPRRRLTGGATVASASRGVASPAAISGRSASSLGNRAPVLEAECRRPGLYRAAAVDASGVACRDEPAPGGVPSGVWAPTRSASKALNETAASHEEPASGF
jgi:hypothetical protein